LFAVFVMRLPYTEKLSAKGIVMPEQKPTRIVAPVQGRLQEVLVREGEEVDAGAIVALVDRRSFAGNGRVRVTLQVREAEEQIRYLEAQLAAGAEIQKLKCEEVAARIKLDRQRLKTSIATRSVLARQGELAKASLARADVLVKTQSLAVADRQHLEVIYLQHEHQRLEQASVIADLQAALLDQQRSIGLLKAQWRFQKSQLQDRVGQLVIKRMRILEGLEEAVRAPVYGQVTDLRIQAGAGVAQGELLFTLVDPNSRPTVELALPSTATGRVLVGMRTKLSFTAYPVTDHGFGDGTIREIAEVANFTDGEAFYRAVVEIDRFPRDAIALPAGMNVSAYLELASNPLWHWFLKPLEATWVQL